MSQQIPTIGRIVHYRAGGTDAEPVLRPAIIVHVWSPGVHSGAVQLQVFIDGSNDRHELLGRNEFTETERINGLAWRTSVTEGEGLNEWRWPAR